MTIEGVTTAHCRMKAEATLTLQAHNNAGDLIVCTIDRVSFRHGKTFTEMPVSSETVLI